MAGTAQGTRASSADPNLAGSVAWVVQTDNAAATQMVTDATSLYVPLVDGRLLALDSRDGRIRWALPASGPYDAAPTVAGDRVYAATRNGEVRAVRSDDGTVVWRRAASGAIATSPLIVGGVVYVVTYTHVQAFDAEDGKTLWERPLGDTLAVVSPVIEGRRLVVASFSRLQFFDLRTGEQTFYLNEIFFPPRSALAIASGRVFVLAQGRLLAFDEAVQRPWWDRIRAAWLWANIVGIAPAVPWRASVWEMPAQRDAFPLALGDSVVVVATESGLTRAFDTASGRKLWERGGEPLRAAPTLTARGLLLVEAHALRLLDPANGVEVIARRLPEIEIRRAVATGHAVFIQTDAGSIAALR